MKLTFKLTNQKFEDFLAVSINGETKDLTKQDNQIHFEVSDIEETTVQVRYIRNNIQRIKNPIGRFFAYLFFLLLSSLIFFADNDNGISIHKFFYGAKPFEWKKIFKIKPMEDMISLKYIFPKYDKAARCFSAPDVKIMGAETMKETFTAEYNPVAMKKEFRLYHYPAYTILFAIIVALNVLMAICLFNQFAPFDLMGVIGMSFCCLVTLALFITFIYIFVSTHRLFNQIDQNLQSKK